MEIIITRAERTVDPKDVIVGISFDISIKDGEDHQSKTYTLTKDEIANLDNVTLDDIVKRETLLVIALFGKDAKEIIVLKQEEIPELMDATIDPVTLDITSK